MNISKLLENLSTHYKDRIVHIEIIPARSARYKEPAVPLPDKLKGLLSSVGIEKLYTHQADAWDMVKGGHNILITTSTASGKTLAYNLPVLDSFLACPNTTALYIFPTKALAQNQLKTLKELITNLPHTHSITPSTYDGDTPQSSRTHIRKKSNIIFTNPDMLHYSILPYHPKWVRFFQNLKFIIIDELHIYRGVFGSHVANVFRRLNRILDFHGANPQYILTSATIGNPKELAERLINKEVYIIDDDGSPAGQKYFILWNPPCIDSERTNRKSANIEATELLTELMKSNVQTICFVRARIIAELTYKYVRDRLLKENLPELSDTVCSYRAGYLPQRRREIERLLFAGRLKAITTTTALELGIDIGSLDAAIIVGYPGSVSSTWQQAGRAGRKTDESVAILIAYNIPIDQYIMHNPEYIFSKDVEKVMINPDNPEILYSHLCCAAQELPLVPQDEIYFSDHIKDILQKTEVNDELYKVDNTYHWSKPYLPATKVNLRTSSPDTYSIIDQSKGELIGTIDAQSAFKIIYPGAIYLQEGQSYFVTDIDIDKQIASVEPTDCDYYTHPIISASAQIIAEEDRKEKKSIRIATGTIQVVSKVVSYKKIQFYSLAVIGIEPVDLPEQSLTTQGFWLSFDNEINVSIFKDQSALPSAITGLVNLFTSALTILASCDSNDISGFAKLTPEGYLLVIYDSYPGGLGFSKKGFDNIDSLINLAYKMVCKCPCKRGCPSCVGLDSIFEGVVPEKISTQKLLEIMLENEWR